MNYELGLNSFMMNWAQMRLKAKRMKWEQKKLKSVFCLNYYLTFFQEEQESAGEVVQVEVDGVPIGHVLVHQVRTFHVLKSLFFTNKNPRICQDYKRGQNTY